MNKTPNCNLLILVQISNCDNSYRPFNVTLFHLIFQSFRAKRVIIHPSYDFDRDLNDIALVELNGYIKNTEEIKPACIPNHLHENITSEVIFQSSEARPKIGELCVTTGWGTTHSKSSKNSRVNKLENPLFGICFFYLIPAFES